MTYAHDLHQHAFGASLVEAFVMPLSVIDICATLLPVQASRSERPARMA